MTRIKICGIMEPAPALAAAEAGADFIGMVFAPSRRRITPEQGRHIAKAVEGACFWESRPAIVGVFADQPLEEIEDVAAQCRLDIIQLSGQEPWELAARMSRPVVKAVKVGPGQPLEALLAELSRGVPLLPPASWVLIEAQVPGAYGGTGQKVDWRLAAAVARHLPVMLAGGLTPENVAEAIRAVAPWGVDVSSGVETQGVKDKAKISAFVAAVRGADDISRS